MELSDVIKNVNIVEFISQFVPLTQVGNEWWGLSCFKKENTPSFSVREDPPFFYDYSSGIGGNLFTFVKSYYKCSNSEAAEIIMKYAKVGTDSYKKKTMDASNVCRKFRPKEKTLKAKSGIVLPKNVMSKYVRDEDKLELWKSEGITNETLARFQVMYDQVSDSLVYPIKNMDGDIVNIGARTMDPDWKAHGKRKYSYFYKWGTLDLLYGLFDNLEYILEKKEVIIFEGCKSVLIADGWGIKNTCALLTSHLNPRQLSILIKLGVRVVFALDKDVDITNDERIKTLKRYVNVEYLYDSEGVLDDKDAPVDKGMMTYTELYTNRRKLR